MLEHIHIPGVLFLDIETVPQHADYGQVPSELKDLWEKKVEALNRHRNAVEQLSSSAAYERAGIYAEFGKVVCVSTGFIALSEDAQRTFRMKSFYGDDERKILSDVSEFLIRWGRESRAALCAHNGREFDFPYLARRMLINSIPLPSLINTAGKKPWEVAHLDTMELWKFGDHKSYTSLNLLAAVFEIPTPKNDMDGSKVGSVYWRDNGMNRIVEYCQRDVITVAHILLRFRGEPLFGEKDIVIA